jgi:hypothetical protein
MDTNKEVDPRLAAKFAALKVQPARDPQKAALGRAAFLAQAQEVANTLPAAKSLPPVSAMENRRHNRWMHALQSFLAGHRKEQSPMFGTLGTVLLIVSLILGGSGITVAAAQSSQPDQGLYPVKIFSEDVRSELTANEQARLRLALEFTNRRSEEMQGMVRAGKMPPDAVAARMQNEIDHALELAAGQPDQQAIKSLEQIRQQIRNHEQSLLHLGSPANPTAEALLNRTSQMLRDRLRLCEDGIQDPDALRERLRERKREGGKPDQTPPGNPWTTGTPTPGSGYGPGPGNGDGNPWTTGTPTPGSGYGPGPGDGSPWTTGTPTPGSGYGPGPGNGDGNPWTTGTPTPGSSYGPGPGPGPGVGNGDGNGPGTGGDNGNGSGNGNGSDAGSGDGSGDGGGSDNGSGGGGSDNGSGGGGSDNGSGGGSGGGKGGK